MIDIIKQTPFEYSKQSRDYQIISRLYSALFNLSKMYIDNLNVWNNDIDDKLTTLRSRTVNFITRHNWDLDDLEAVTSCFKYLMINKGAVAAVEACVNILMKIEGIDNSEVVDNMISIDEKYMVTIIIPKELKTIGIVEDLVSYLLPAGLSYRIISGKNYNVSDILVSDVTYSDSYTSESVAKSNKLLIGNNTDRENYINETYVYNDSEGNLIPDWNR